jgi:AcrR family transcriptional regulator
MPSEAQGASDRLEAGPRLGLDGRGDGRPAGQTPPRGAPSGRTAGVRLSDVQGARILAAMVDVASELGAANATVARVVARSGVSRRTFYELFADREACFLAAFDQAVARTAAVVVPAYEQTGRWRSKIRSALAALLELLDREPAVASLLIVESLGAGPKALERRQNVQLQIIPILDRGHTGAKRGGAPPPLTAEGIVGGVLSLIHARVLAGAGPLLDLLNPLMAIVVLPYLGAPAARRELAQPVPPSPNGTRTAPADPLRDLDMRLTYRTMRVLLAIGELGGRGSYPSNRQVGDAAGIRDQGQVSKLLARLQQLDLIENTGEARAKGEPNKWQLTQRGKEVREVLAP